MAPEFKNSFSTGNMFLFVLICCDGKFISLMYLQLIVQAKVLNTDLEHNQLSSVVPVFINVSDVDDNYPRFLQQSYW